MPDLLSARGRELVAGSYNIRCDTPVDGDNAWPYRKERVEALIRFYGFDVLGVQEAKPSQMSDLRVMPGFRIGGCGPRRGRPGRIFGDLLSHGPSPGTRQRHVLALRDARYRFQRVGCGLEPDMHMGQDEGSAHGARVLFFQYPFRSRRPRGEAPVGRIACRAYPGRSGRPNIRCFAQAISTLMPRANRSP